MTDILTNTATPTQITEAGNKLVAAVMASVNTQPARVTGKKAAKEKVACRCSAFTAENGEYIECEAKTGRLFAPGHDAKLKGLLLRAAVAGVGVYDAESERTLPAIMVAEQFGFGQMVADGLAKRAAKAAARVAGGPVSNTQEDPSAGGPAQEDPQPVADEDSESEISTEELASIVADQEAEFAEMMAEVAAERVEANEWDDEVAELATDTDSADNYDEV